MKQRSGLYNRANTLRMNQEFDMASQLYQMILSEEENEPEAYWAWRCANMALNMCGMTEPEK